MGNERITIELIEQKEFKQKVRGYDPEEVDAFLDDICDEIIALQDEIDELHQQLAQKPAVAKPQAVPVSFEAEAPKPRVAAEPVVSNDATEQFKAILANAQKVSDLTIKEAHERADAIVEKAKGEADKKLGSLEEEHVRLQDEIEILKNAAKDYRDRFHQLVEDQKHVLAAQKELFK
jgi:DivIVA domain